MVKQINGARMARFISLIATNTVGFVNVTQLVDADSTSKRT